MYPLSMDKLFNLEVYKRLIYTIHPSMEVSEKKILAQTTEIKNERGVNKKITFTGIIFRVR